MSILRCLLVDDEHFALTLLEKYVRDTPGLEVAAACRSAVRAVEILQNDPVDILFLDIQMPVLSGMGLLKSISRKPATIFTTAYAQHAHEAFDLDAIDYLLKPYSYERFLHAVDKARFAIQARDPAGALPDGHLQVKADRRIVKIPYAEIVYIEGWKEYVKIYTEHQKIITLESLNKLEQTLPAAHFLRTHKSYIVGRRFVRSLEGDELALSVEGARVPVARARKRAVSEELFG